MEICEGTWVAQLLTMEICETHRERTALPTPVQGQLMNTSKWLLDGVVALTESQKEQEHTEDYRIEKSVFMCKNIN